MAKNISINQLYKNVIRCWRSIEEVTPPILEIKNNPPTVIKIIKEVVGDEELPWLKSDRPVSSDDHGYYYTIFIGAIPVDTMLNQIRQIFNIKKEKYSENFNSAKRTCLASLTLNEDGIYNNNGKIEVPDYLISMAARIKYGSQYDNQVNYAELRNRLEQGISEIIQNAFCQLQKPANTKLFQEINKSIYEFIGWNNDAYAEPHTNNVIIYMHKILISAKKNISEESYKNYFNSFFVADLKKVEANIDHEKCSATLSKYLSLNNANRQDVRNDGYYRSVAVPENIPPARWPSKGDHPLVLSQMVAVKEALSNNSMFSINGPPGTGKTTLLKDIIANIIYKKAVKIANLSRPEDMFTDKGVNFTSGRYNYKLWPLKNDFLDFITVIASSNNEAVENISKELPFSIDHKWEIDYFQNEAEYIFSKKGASGLFSAALGNASNKNSFFDKFWNSENNNSCADSFRSLLQHSHCSFKEWKNAKCNLENKIAEYNNIIKELSEVNASFMEMGGLKIEIEKLQIEKKALMSDLADFIDKISILSSDVIQWQKNIENQQKLIELDLRSKPSLLYVIVSLLRWEFPLQDWHANLKTSKNTLADYITSLTKGSAELRALNLNKDVLEEKLTNIENKIAIKIKLYKQLSFLQDKYREIFASANLTMPDDAFWQQDDDIIQAASPWLYPEIQQIRAEIFKLSCELIKCTIFCNKTKLSQNINVIKMMLSYGNLPKEYQAYAIHAWNSFAFIVPVVSSTFSSFAALFKDLGREDISYLLIDEAGQTSPHKAVGAIWRSKRVVVVGDPLQIEPVETLSEEFGAEITKSKKIKSEYNPLASSVQAFADYSNSIGTYISNSDGKFWVGSPLRVHRRCNNPMFKVANEISYDDSMIYKSNNKPLSPASIFTESLWIAIKNGYVNDKYVKEEGEAVLKILNNIIARQKALPSLFIISPFTNVARNVKYLLMRKLRWPSNIREEDKKLWLNKSVGTIHTFQGKEADIVIIVLGCDKRSAGAIDWASAKPNILNVALTRARQIVLVVGDSNIWGGKQFFNVLHRNIKLIEVTALESDYLSCA